MTPIFCKNSRCTRPGPGAKAVVVELELAENLGVLLAQRLPTAREIIEHVVEFFRVEIAEGISAPHQPERVLARPLRCAAHAHELLRQHIEWGAGDADFVEMPGASKENGGARFDEIAHVGCHKNSPADGVDIVSGPSSALQRLAHAFRGREHDDEFDRADVDAEFETGRADHGAELAAFQSIFDIAPHVALERGMVALDNSSQLGKFFAQPIGRRLSARAGVGKDKGGAVLLDQIAEFAHQPLAGETSLGIRVLAQRSVDAKVDFLCGGDIDDGAAPVSADEKLRDFGERRDGCGKADALECGMRSAECGMSFAPPLFTPHSAFRIPHLIESLDAQREVRPALVVREGVDFIDDQPAGVAKLREPLLLAEQDAETLRRSEEDVRRLGKLPHPLAGARVAGAQLDADRWLPAEEFAQRLGEIFFQIVTERAQWGDINAVDRVAQLSAGVFLRERVEHGEKGGKRLSRPGGRGDEHIFSSREAWPGVALRRGRAPVARAKPPENARVSGERRHALEENRRVTRAGNRNLGSEPTGGTSRCESCRPLAFPEMTVANHTFSCSNADARPGVDRLLRRAVALLTDC